MRSIIVGYGIQGKKRADISLNSGTLVGLVDPAETEAKQYAAATNIRYERCLKDFPDDEYDAVVLCVPDLEKVDLIDFALSKKKSVLVEKPLLTGVSFEKLCAWRKLIEESGNRLQVAYNHRYEPAIIEAADFIAEGGLGQLYSAYLFYGNGTAQLVKASPWRDEGLGVVPDLFSHLWDIFNYFFPDTILQYEYFSGLKNETKAYDHATIFGKNEAAVTFEVTLTSWRNTFRVDLVGSRGSLHVDSLCKWGPSSLKIRRRISSTGRPDEIEKRWVQNDPTWETEYLDFLSKIESGGDNLESSFQLLDIFEQLNELRVGGGKK